MKDTKKYGLYVLLKIVQKHQHNNIKLPQLDNFYLNLFLLLICIEKKQLLNIFDDWRLTPYSIIEINVFKTFQKWSMNDFLKRLKDKKTFKKFNKITQWLNQKELTLIDEAIEVIEKKINKNKNSYKLLSEVPKKRLKTWILSAAFKTNTQSIIPANYDFSNLKYKKIKTNTIKNLTKAELDYQNSKDRISEILFSPLKNFQKLM